MAKITDESQKAGIHEHVGKGVAGGRTVEVLGAQVDG